MSLWMRRARAPRCELPLSDQRTQARLFLQHLKSHQVREMASQAMDAVSRDDPNSIESSVAILCDLDAEPWLASVLNEGKLHLRCMLVIAEKLATEVPETDDPVAVAQYASEILRREPALLQEGGTEAQYYRAEFYAALVDVCERITGLKLAGEQTKEKLIDYGERVRDWARKKLAEDAGPSR